jgi:hypothetical protein
MIRLDRILISLDWAQQFPNTIQRALPNAISDHCPIMYISQTKFSCPNTFKIENYWLKESDFAQMVITQWQTQTTAQTPHQLCEKLKNLRKSIIQWKKSKSNRWREQMQTCLQCLQWLDLQEESRSLDAIENILRTILRD